MKIVFSLPFGDDHPPASHPLPTSMFIFYFELVAATAQEAFPQRCWGLN